MNLPPEVPLKEQKSILKYLLDIPPFEYLGDCDTDDRLEHWKDCKIFYSSLRVFLKNHLGGTSLPTKNIYIEDLKIMVSLSDTLYQTIGSHLDYYLKLYSVLSWGWKCIAPILEEARTRTHDPSIPETPGEALIQILDQHLHGLFYVYFPEKVTGNYYKEYSPRKAYKLKTEDTKVKLLKKKKLEDLTVQEKRKIAAHERTLKKEHKLLKPFVSLEKFYLSICLQNEKGDATLKRRLADLKTIASQLQTDITKRQHPRNKSQGYAISRGVLLPGTNRGGVYGNS